jgi:hypothetical protein
MRHGSHRKRRVQQFFFCCVCIHCRGNVFTEPLPSNDGGIHIQTHRLMGGIYKVLRWDGLRCHDIHTKFHKDWFGHSEINKGDTQTHRQHYDRISLVFSVRSYFEKIKVGLWDHVAICVSVAVYPPIVARLGLGKSPLIVARQQLGKKPPIVARQRLG